MSGFICILNTDQAPVDPVLLQRMTDSMVYRGPDDQGIWSDGNIGMGHTLLHTTWESEQEHQPLARDGRLWICGDIRLDRRETLADTLGVKPSEIPDVDLVLWAYDRWGDDCVDHLAGDFSFAIWDKPAHKLFCARDHFGICPLFHAKVGNSLIVSNDLWAMQLHPRVSDRLNEQTVGDHLLFGMNMNRATTIYADIASVPPAQILIGGTQGISVRAYWDGPEERAYVRYPHPEEYVERFRALFERAVADRLRSNRAGSHLSGGMDASSIAVTAHRLLRETSGPGLHAYTIVYRELCDEEEGCYARMIAEYAGFAYEEFVAEDYILRSPATYSDFMAPEPFVIPNMVAEFDIVRRTVGVARTLFAGFGGDPAFEFKPTHWGQLLRQGRGLDLLRELADHYRTFRRRPAIGLRAVYRHWRQARDCAEIPSWIDSEFAARIGLRERQQAVFAAGYVRSRKGMAEAPLWSNIFAAGDPGASGIPVKLRYPFFDRALIDFLCTVPAGGWFPNKHLLRKSMQGALPDEVLRRPKTPLGTSPHFHKRVRAVSRSWQADLASTTEFAAFVNKRCLMERLGDDASLIDLNRTIRVWPLAFWLRQRGLTQS